MAKNWTMAEAIGAFVNDDKASIMDIGRRFPLSADTFSRIVASDCDSAIEMIERLPEFMTMGKLEKSFKSTVGEDAEVEEKEEAEVEAEDAEDSDKKVDYKSMSAKAIFELGKSRGIKFESTKKADMIAVLEAIDNGEGEKVEEEDDEDSAEEKSKYAGKTSPELYKECKKRGIKTETRLPAEDYVKLLEKDDEAKAAKAKKAQEEEEDDWGDEEEVKEEKVEKTKKASTKAKKPAKEDDDDDDWDI